MKKEKYLWAPITTQEKAVATIESFLAAKAELADTHSWISPGIKGISHTEYDETSVEVPIAGGYTLNVAKRNETRVFLGIRFGRDVRYQVIESHPASRERFSDDTPEELAPDVGYQHWDFMASSPDELYAFWKQRRFDHYEPLGGGNRRLSESDRGREFFLIDGILSDAMESND